MYQDVVLRQRPVTTYPMTPTFLTTDASSYVATTIPGTSIWRKGFIPQGRALKADVSVTNAGVIASSARQTRQFSVDLWANVPFGSATGTLFDATNALIRYDNDRIIFEIKDSTNKWYTCWRTVPVITDVKHICAVFNGVSLVVVVNTVPGEPVVVPNTFAFGSTVANVTLKANTGAISIFNRASSSQEILDRWLAGTTAQPYQDVCTKDGADFWDFSRRSQPLAAQIIVDNQDWSDGVSYNTIVDKEGSLTMNYHQDMKFYSSGVEATAAYSGSRVTIGATGALTRSGAGVLSNSGCIIAMNVAATTPGTTKTILSIHSPTTGTQWRWFINSSSQLRFEVVQVDSSGNETVTTSTYDTTVSTSFNFVAVIEKGTVRVHSGAAGLLTYNTISGVTNFPASISLNEGTMLYFGSDRNFTGPGIDSLANIMFWNNVPVFTSFANLLTLSTDRTTYYPVAADLLSRTTGWWEYSFVFPYTGAYEGSSIDWEGSYENGAGTYGAIKLRYSATTATVTARGAVLPSSVFANSGNLGSGVPSGPYVLRLELFSVGANIGHFRSVTMNVFKTNTVKSVNTDRVATFNSYAHTSRMEFDEPWRNNHWANIRFSGNCRLLLPSATFRVVEFVYRANASDTGILFNTNDGTSRTVSVSANVITQTNFASMYVNGTLTASYTAEEGESVHIIVIGTADITATLAVGQNTDGSGTTAQVGVWNLATYDYVLDAATITEHYLASRGLVYATNSGADSIVLTEVEPYVYTLAWETTGATT
jgi:hypothetical protein